MGNSWNWKQTLAFFLFFIPPLFFYALQKNATESFSGSSLQAPAHWLQQFYDGFTHKVQESLNTYVYLVGINLSNQQLKVENARLSSQMQLLEEYRVENVRLRELFKFQQEFPRETLAARIISKDIFLNEQSLTIDKGREDGVKRLQGVISANGVVGYTIEVEDHSARILLLSNHNASIDALVQRTRARGVVSGHSVHSYRMNYMMREEDALVGDLIVTSGRQGFFPKGFHIGTVTDMGPSPTGVSFQAKIKPSVNMDRLENVLVIIEKRLENHSAQVQ
jgi:rod shape-determining protein MreC